MSGENLPQKLCLSFLMMSKQSSMPLQNKLSNLLHSAAEWIMAFYMRREQTIDIIMALSDRQAHRHQHGFRWQHRLCPSMVSWTTDNSMVLSSNTGHGHQHGTMSNYSYSDQHNTLSFVYLVSLVT